MAEYAVVVESNVAEAVYNAILKVSAAVLPRTTPTPKLWMPSSISTLKLVTNDWVIDNLNSDYLTG